MQCAVPALLPLPRAERQQPRERFLGPACCHRLINGKLDHFIGKVKGQFFKNALVKRAGNLMKQYEPDSTETCSFGLNEPAHLTIALKNRPQEVQIQTLDSNHQFPIMRSVPP